MLQPVYIYSTVEPVKDGRAPKNRMQATSSGDKRALGQFTPPTQQSPPPPPPPYPTELIHPCNITTLGPRTDQRPPIGVTYQRDLPNLPRRLVLACVCWFNPTMSMLDVCPGNSWIYPGVELLPGGRLIDLQYAEHKVLLSDNAAKL